MYLQRLFILCFTSSSEVKWGWGWFYWNLSEIYPKDIATAMGFCMGVKINVTKPISKDFPLPYIVTIRH